MSDHFRSKVISKLVEDIAHLTGGNFEQFAYKVMPLLHEGNWEERGTTIDGAPRKATVDTSSDGAAYVGEMSSTANYFEDMKKPKADLEHAYGVHNQAKRIWLLSSREASAGQTVDIANAESEFLKAHPSVDKVEILDARAIALRLFENLGNSRLVTALTPYLPTIGRLAEEHAFSHATPSIASLVARMGLEARITSHLTTHPYVVLRGMSGAGKTALAARVATNNKATFDNVIWIDARDITSLAQLSNVSVLRTGTTHNITSILRNGAVLLVLDDPAFSIEELVGFDIGRSKMIVTTQVASGPHIIPVGDVEEQEALAILTRDIDTPCPPELVAKVRSMAGGHALLLRALNRLALENGWDEVESCLVSESMDGLEDDLHEKIFRRVLRRQLPHLTKELAFIRWWGTPRFHIELESVVSSLAVRNLAKRGFLAATSPGFARVHDLVFKAIQREVQLSEEQRASLRKSLALFVRAESDSDRLLLQRIARVQSEFFKQLAAEEREPSSLYMVGLGRTGESSIALLGDPRVEAAALAARPSLLGANLEVRAIIEAVEALYTLRTDYRTKDEAISGLRNDISALTLILGHKGLSAEQRKILEHHEAKMLVHLDQKTEAEAAFRRILASDPSFAAARLQLARIIPKSDAIAECDTIFAQHDRDPSSVSLNVLLEALRTCAFNDADMSRYEARIMKSIEQAAGMDLAVAISVISSVSQRTHLKHPDLVLRMFSAIDWQGLVPAPNERFDWAQAHKFAAKAAWDQQPLRERFLNAAVDVYSEAPLSKPYHRTQYAEALLLLNRNAEADQQLEAVPPEKRDAFLWQRKAQALTRLGRHEDALGSIDSALKALAPKDERYRPTFLADRFRIRAALRDEGALEDLDRAIALLPPEDSNRKRLESEREEHVAYA